MSLENFFDHTCDIYHLRKGDNEDLGYRVKGAPVFDYPDEPDVSAIPCHFHSTDVTLSQQEPHNDLAINTKLSMPAGTDLRILDKVVCRETGREFTVKNDPRTVRGHHMYAYVERERVQKPL